MTPESNTSRRASQVAVPAGVRALSTLLHIDYEDAFLVDVATAQERTPEQWAREVLENAPTSVRRTLQSGWTAIGLKLGGAAADRSVLGWGIRRSTPEYVLLGAESRIGMAGELLFKRQRRTLLIATFVQQDNDVARAVWAGVEPVHVPFVRNLLEQTSLRCSRGA
jgi:hypothetical protein